MKSDKVTADYAEIAHDRQENDTERKRKDFIIKNVFAYYDVTV